MKSNNCSASNKSASIIKSRCNLLVLCFVFLYACEKDEIRIDIPPKLTFDKLSHQFSVGKFTQKEIFEKVGGKKAGYVIKQIKDVSPANTVEIKGKNIIFRKVGAFTATLVLKHPSKLDATIKKAPFEITKSDAAKLTFKKLTEKYRIGGRFDTAAIIANIQGNKKDYALKEIKDLSTSDFATINKLKINFIKAGRFTATLVLTHPNKADVTIKNAQFEITIVPITPFDKTYGGAVSEVANDMIRTDDGGFAIVGKRMESGGDVYLVKLDSKGNQMWSRTYGGAKNDDAKSIIQTKDGGYMLAGFTESKGAGTSDAWLIKVDSKGDTQWDKTYGGVGYEQANDVVQTSDGGYVFGGYTNSIGAGGKDVWLVKTDSKGDEQWAKTTGGVGTDEAEAMIQTKDGGYVTVGSKTNVKTGSDVLLVKFNHKGVKQWEKTYVGTGREEGNGVVQTKDGGYAISGINTKRGLINTDIWLIKTDAKGDKQWDKTYGSLDQDFNAGLVQTMDGGYALVGSTFSRKKKFEVLLIKTDKLGNKQWSQTYGDTIRHEKGYAIVANADGSFFIAGYKWGRLYDMWVFHVPKR